MSEDLFPWQRSNLRESVLFVIRIHGLNLFLGWGSENLDDLNQLVDTTLSWEDRLAEHEFGDDATN